MFGFTRFANVRDVEKLSETLNNIYFGDYRLFANMACYDRFEKFDRRNFRVGDGEKMMRNEERKFSREYGRREPEFGFRRKKEFERVKNEALRSED